MPENQSQPSPVRLISSLSAGAAATALAAALIAGYGAVPASLAGGPQAGGPATLTAVYVPGAPLVPPNPIVPPTPITPPTPILPRVPRNSAAEL